MNIETPRDDDDADDGVIHMISVPEPEVLTEVKPSEEPLDEDFIPATAEEPKDEPADASETDENVDVASSEPVNEEFDTDDIEYPEGIIDLRGEALEKLTELLVLVGEEHGPAGLDARVRTPGSYENILARSIFDAHLEDIRMQSALGALDKADREAMSDRLINPETGKVRLRNNPIKVGVPKGKTEVDVSGTDALIMFERIGNNNNTSTIRVLLYNSGISIDLLSPTLNNYETLLMNCRSRNEELGAAMGFHYFAYADLIYKDQIINFVQSLIIDTSYKDWNKNGKLWSLVKITDLAPLMMALAAASHRKGFENFVIRCSNPAKPICGHTETINADLAKMVLTRWNMLDEASIRHMEATRQRVGHRHAINDIAKYQSELNLEGERIEVDHLTFVMRIPTVTEYLDAGVDYISSIRSEIQGDNTEGQYLQMGLRYIRVYLPWISSMEGKSDDGVVVRTSDRTAIARELDKLDALDSERIRNKLTDYINRVQLTYVGYPVFECPKCHHHPDTPSGLFTFDPVSAFFTLASPSTPQKKPETPTETTA